ncbi:MAG: bifunctional (p)ppGpp synthetase/guanosine-3',5'-bis(diphosphate) 3'-pyrophosphohydrolase [Flavobacteriales bacterium]|nr:bifunctional (p)ppGpp synthetase/guanosine-3',5'-bis(diphosphate) 3'-pyrophosphohydrolase [Flavobacteriales bacterium]
MDYNVDIEQENREIKAKYKQMLKSCYRLLSSDDLKMIRKAFEIAKDGHKDQRRNTGEPYIYHPIAVARIVCEEIGLDARSIAAALLHDVVEDTHYTIEDIERLFDAKMAKIVSGLTKISVINNQDISIQSENFRKLLLTLSEDIRVILIKIADRLHNMRTLDGMKPEKQKKIASETMYIYAPLAHRMGLYSIKSELEDLSLKYNDSSAYHKVEKKLEESRQERESYIKKFSELVTERLDEENIEYTIKGRPKSISSILKKIKTQKIPFEEIYDKFAIRIIYKSEPKNEKFIAWKIYSIITDQFKPNPSRMRDWISQPRSTGYESLHITVIGPEGKWVEVQIRSERMDEVAEKGIAAHYKYKEGYADSDNQIEHWIQQIRELLENQNEQSTKELLDDFQLNLYSSEIFIFTPKGDLKVLPFNATALDFAYSVHTNVGDTCLGAKVNGKLVPLSYQLQSGDRVEVITSENQKPNPDWLNYVITSRAKSKIKQALNAETKKLADEGKEILIRKLRHLKITFNQAELNRMMSFFKLKTSQDLFYNVKSGKIDSKELKRYAESKGMLASLFRRIRRKSTTEKKEEQESSTKNLDLIVFGLEEQKLEYSFAECCSPIPGDKVFGFVSINQGIKVHTNSCPNAVELRAKYNYRILKAKWVDSTSLDSKAILSIVGIDKMGIINIITQTFTKLGVNILSVNSVSDDGIFEGKWVFNIKNRTQLKKLIELLRGIEGISKVSRIK